MRRPRSTTSSAMRELRVARITRQSEIHRLYLSPGHNFFGHHGREPDNFPAIEVPALDCVRGRGIRGDRFFDYKVDYKGQISFFALEVFDQLCDALAGRDCS